MVDNRSIAKAVIADELDRWKKSILFGSPDHVLTDDDKLSMSFYEQSGRDIEINIPEHIREELQEHQKLEEDRTTESVRFVLENRTYFESYPSDFSELILSIADSEDTDYLEADCE